MDPKLNKVAMMMQKVAVTSQTGEYYDLMLQYLENMHDHYRGLNDEGALISASNSPSKHYKSFSRTSAFSPQAAPKKVEEVH